MGQEGRKSYILIIYSALKIVGVKVCHTSDHTVLLGMDMQMISIDLIDITFSFKGT